MECKFKEGGEISPQIVQNLNIPFDQIYASSENILKIAKAIREDNNNSLTVLPFCHTVEAKALGADIKPADAVAGPRPGSYVYTSLEDLTKKSVSENIETQKLLEACKSLKAEGDTVAFMVTGPISILSNLMDLTTVFKAWRKQPEKVQQAFDTIEEVLLEFIGEISNAGADIISFADPAGNPDILGAKYNQLLTDMFLFPFLKKAIAACGENTSLCVCPLAASNLSKQGLISKSETKDGNLACACIKNVKLPLNMMQI